MLYLAQGSIGDCTTDAIWALVFIGSIYSIYLAGRVAERRGRSFRFWAYAAAIILGPLAIPVLLLLPNLHRANGDPA